MKKSIALIWLIVQLGVGVALAAEGFKVKEIRVEGLQRATQGAVLRQLPIKVGDTFEFSNSGEVIEAVYKTGYFQQIDLSQDGQVLIISVIEKPSIGELILKGIRSKDKVMKILKEHDLVEGRFYDTTKLAKAKHALERHYLINGRYGVKIQSEVKDAPRNRVLLTLDIYEGDVAKIQGIRIVGNEAFKEKTLLKLFRTKRTNILSWLTKSDRYAHEKLEADLEDLRNYYLDRGYIQFQVESTQVTLTPDRKHIYVTIGVSEGDLYHFGKIEVPSVYPVPEDKVHKVIDQIEPHSPFSRKQLIDLKDNVQTLLGNEGYYFADVRPMPETDEQSRTVDVYFEVDRKDKIHVRRIHLLGNHTTQDEVLRRELRQMEAAPISTERVKAGKVRIEHKGFSRDVQIEAKKVPGVPDQVDLFYGLEEQRLGQFEAGLGYSSAEKLSYHISVSQQNFFGTGKSGHFTFNQSRVTTTYSLGYYNPYFTVNEVGLGSSVYYTDTDLTKVSSVSEYAKDTIGADVSLGFPIGAHDYLRFTLGHTRNHIRVSGRQVAKEVRRYLDRYGDEYNETTGSVSWRHSTLNRPVFPTKGFEHELVFQSVLPGAKIEYYQLFHDTKYYWPLSKSEKYLIKFKTKLGYGDGFGKSSAFGLPFHKHYYAGGADTVRGYEERSLGPKDSNGKEFGGNALVAGTVALIFPNPIKPDLESVRTGLFFDLAQVYDTRKRVKNPDGLRYSVGLSLAWNSPLGAPLLFSFSKPLNKKPGDKTEAFTFSFTSSF